MSKKKSQKNLEQLAEDKAFKEFKTNWSPLKYQQDLERTGVPKILAEVEMRQYLQLYNKINRYWQINMEMREFPRNSLQSNKSVQRSVYGK